MNTIIFKIGFDCDDGEKHYLTVSLPENLENRVCEDSNIGYYYDTFNDKLMEKHDTGIDDYIIEDIIPLPSDYDGTIDIIIEEDEEDKEIQSDDEYTTLCINPFLKKIRIPRNECNNNNEICGSPGK